MTGGVAGSVAGMGASSMGGPTMPRKWACVASRRYGFHRNVGGAHAAEYAGSALPGAVPDDVARKQKGRACAALLL